MSEDANELILNATISPIGWVMRKGYKLIHLREQYRMDPKLALFPNPRFYGGNLRDNWITQEDPLENQGTCPKDDQGALQISRR